ncbi:hypothetical protein MASR2M79_22120 [Aminivibrio sp.]
MILVPNKLGTKKHGPDYRFLAIRERWIGDLSLEKLQKKTQPRGIRSLRCG